MKKYLFLSILVVFLSFQLGAQDGGESRETPPGSETTQDLPDENTIIIEDTENPAEEAAPGGATITAWDIVRMILILVGVLIAIYAIFHLMRKAGGPKFQDSGLITMHASLGLGGNKSVHLIETGQEFFLIGAGETGVNLLSKIEAKDAVDDIRFKISTAGENRENRNFADIFSRLFRKGVSDVNLGNSISRNRDFMKEQRERLKKM